MTEGNFANTENYLYRGLIGKVFSQGLDEFNEKRLGGTGRVLPYGAANQVTTDIITRWKTYLKPDGVHLIGHSLGARAAVEQANKLTKAGVPIVSVFLLDYVGGNRWWYPVQKLHRDLQDGRVIHWRSNDSRTRKVEGAVEIPYAGTHIQLDDDKEVWNKMVEFDDRLFEHFCETRGYRL